MILQKIDRKQWDEFVASRDEANFLQSWQWGDVHEKEGNKVIRRGIMDGEKLAGVVQGIIMDAKRGRYMQIGGGPLIDWATTETKDIVDGIRQIAREEQCVFVRMRPQLEKTDENMKLFADLGAKQAPMHLNAQDTSIIDLTKSEDELIASMRKQTRYEVRKADKLGIKVEMSTDEAVVDEFFEIQKDTANRHGFVAPSRQHLGSIISSMEGAAKIYKATAGDKTLAMALMIFYGNEADYYEGASTLDGRKLPGGYAIQWRAIRDAKSAGKTRYNLWGIAPEGAGKDHRFAGVSTFKKGFGGEEYIFVPAHDLVISEMRYLKNLAVEKARKKVRRL